MIQQIQQLFWPIMMLLGLAALLFVTQVFRKWRYTAHGLRKGDEFSISATKNMGGQYLVTKHWDDGIEAKKKD